MSLTEIREQIAGLTIEERLDIAALIAHLNRAEDPNYKADMNKRISNINAGKKTSLADLGRLHRKMVARGQ